MTATTSTMHRLLACALLVTFLAYSACPAAAAPPKSDAHTEAEVLARTATELFKLKQFDKAAQLFMQAYGKSHKPALVYNAARAYEEAGKVGDATALFRLYLTIADDADGIVEARERLKALNARPNAPDPVPHQAEPPKPVAPDKAALGPEPMPTKPPVQPEPAVAPPQAAEQAAPVVPEVVPTAAPGVQQVAKPASSRTWAWVASGGSLALLGGGAALLWLGARDSHAANQMVVRTSADLDAYNAAFDKADALEGLGAVAVGLGVAVGGLAVWRHASSGAHVTATTDGRGLWIAGRW